MKKAFLLTVFCLAALAGARSAAATETENLGIRVLPAPSKVAVDGKPDDWDLSGGIFACGDVENAANKFAVWFHAMYDSENLYLLARWNDPTPMNHSGSVKGDYGFVGDCLQVRIVTAPDVTAADVTTTDQNANDAPLARTSHITCWRDRDKLDVVNFEYGRRFNEGKIGDAKRDGAAQAFLALPNGKGYVQEIALPWKLLTKPGVKMQAGSRMLLTLEPNFTVGTGGRLTIKDLFKPGVAIDRVFTFMGNGSWGFATLQAAGKVQPAAVRLADGRTFAVRIEGGLPIVDWTGLTKSQLPDGFKPIKIDVPEDGYVSLNLFAPDGSVARQLLTSHFLTKGEHEVIWDGLTTMSVRKPGHAVPAGQYTWQAIHHTGIGLKLRGWAANSGSAPWRGWGADHGNPVAAAAAGNQVFLGWSGGEGDKPLQACDTAGNIKWKNIRGGIANAGPIATDGTTVYAFNSVGQYAAKAIYRVDAKTGNYTEWTTPKSTDLTMEALWPDTKDVPEGPTSLAAAKGKVFVSFHGKNAVLVVDAVTGNVVKQLDVPQAVALAAVSPEQIWVVSGSEVVALDVSSGARKTAFKPALADKDWVSSLAVDTSGNVYAGVRGNHHYVEVFTADGKPLRTIGRKEGRRLIGAWTPDGMLNVAGLAIDGEGQLWVAEDDTHPKRVSVWDAETGKLKAEYFGSSSYGAIGAAVNPQNPNLLVGQGCEWRIDPQTGRATCLGVITRDGMGASRFGFGPSGKLYLAVTATMLGDALPVRIYERQSDALYKLRTEIRPIQKTAPDGKKFRSAEVWSDANDDAQPQPDEVKSYDVDLGGWLAGWYMPMTPDLTFYGTMYQLRPTGWTACGAPQYDLTAARKLPGPADAAARGGMGAQHGHGSADNKYMLWNAGYGEDHSTMDCYDIASGRRLWSYPSNFTGVHGSHRACGPTVGMLRGAYDICGSAHLPAPIGNIWVVPTNKGEWHVLTEKGFYLTKFFESDPTKVVFPDQAVPGVSLDTCPPGAGEEAFGGSITLGVDGRLSVQAGHVSYWNCDVVGLDTVHALPGGSLTIAAADVSTAETFRQRYLQEASTLKRLVARRATVSFSGDVAKDFSGADIADYKKDDATACRTALAWDDKNLYVGWQVKDATPWVNGADAPEFLYARGDTVDLQLGTDPKADKNRADGVLGDMRISIGPFGGKPTVVVYRKVATDKRPKVFNSGVTQGYRMDSVLVIADSRVEVKVDTVNKRYTVETALPLAALGFTPSAGSTIRADFGATHGDKEGRDTVLRSYWSNQNTGLVSDEVYELQMTPAAWGEIKFE